VWKKIASSKNLVIVFLVLKEKKFGRGNEKNTSFAPKRSVIFEGSSLKLRCRVNFNILRAQKGEKILTT